MATAITPISTKTQLQPLGDHVLVRRKAADEKTAGGIVLPDAAKKESLYAKVLAVGNGKLRDDGTRIPPVVKPGDCVVLAEYDGAEFETEGNGLLLVREHNILALIRD